MGNQSDPGTSPRQTELNIGNLEPDWSPIALRVGQREVNGTMRASVSYSVYTQYICLSLINPQG